MKYFTVRRTELERRNMLLHAGKEASGITSNLVRFQTLTGAKVANMVSNRINGIVHKQAAQDARSIY